MAGLLPEALGEDPPASPSSWGSRSSWACGHIHPASALSSQGPSVFCVSHKDGGCLAGFGGLAQQFEVSDGGEHAVQLVLVGIVAFRDYAVPNAVIRFRQGFGRLIRHRTDRGVAILADTRLYTKGYGAIFRRNLPAELRRYDDEAALLADVAGFLGRAENG